MIGNYLHSPNHNRNVWHDLADRLPELGWSVFTTSTRESPFLRLLDMLWSIWSKRNHYDIAQIDVFSGRAFTFAEWSARLLHLLRKPFILTLHGGGLPDFARVFPGRVKALLTSASKVVTPSPFMQRSLVTFRPDIIFIPNPIEVTQMRFRKRRILSPHLIWVRAFHEIYNPVLAVRVINRLREQFPIVKLTMVGPDKQDGSLERVQLLIKDLGLQANIDLILGVPSTEIPILLNTADVFINTTNYDTAPRSLIEAMGCGLCVVSTNVGGIPWLVTDEVDGLLVPPDNPTAMTAAVSRLLKDPTLAETLSTNARSKAENYNWNAVLPQWDQALIQILEAARE